MVETVDSAKLASALSSSWGKQNKQNLLNIMVQVNTSEEDSKYIYFSIILIIVITIDHILLITMLTIKILFAINSLKKTIPSKHYLQFLSFKKKHLVLIRKNSFN